MQCGVCGQWAQGGDEWKEFPMTQDIVGPQRNREESWHGLPLGHGVGPVSVVTVTPPACHRLYFLCVSKKAGPPKNKTWMSHLHVPQRELERLLLARMESRNHFLKNPRFFPPNTPYGGKSLLFPPKKPLLVGDLEQRWVFPGLGFVRRWDPCE